jgi:hypothetical protein
MENFLLRLILFYEPAVCMQHDIVHLSISLALAGMCTCALL